MTPACTAAFQPTEIDMSSQGASGVSTWLGGAQSVQSSVPGTRRVDCGAVEREWTPPATTARSMPALIDAAPVHTAARPDAQWRLWARPDAPGMPASMAA